MDSTQIARELFTRPVIPALRGRIQFRHCLWASTPGRIVAGRVGRNSDRLRNRAPRCEGIFLPNTQQSSTPGDATSGKFAMDDSLRTSSIVVVAKEQVSCPLGEESAILNLKNSVYYGLDPVGARVWTLLQQPRSVGELRDTLLSEYDVEARRCEQDLLALLETMRIEGLIEVRSVSAV
jgi:Coenzyme PQQ synthesis protein D (PqqD)